MNKREFLKLQVGDKVVCNSCIDATIRTVEAIPADSFEILISWLEGMHKCKQWVDYTLLEMASKEQLNYCYEEKSLF